MPLLTLPPEVVPVPVFPAPVLPVPVLPVEEGPRLAPEPVGGLAGTVGLAGEGAVVVSEPERLPEPELAGGLTGVEGLGTVTLVFTLGAGAEEEGGLGTVILISGWGETVGLGLD
uniref:Uncharacterized protein n=1 Tax=Cyanothece sp. (strain PCC 7425 / ATCC 29141) TaxID=395961 RepID=B8HN70_CYAP4